MNKRICAVIKRFFTTLYARGAIPTLSRRDLETKQDLKQNSSPYDTNPMSHTFAIVLQVLGYECLFAMVTTIRIEDYLVFDLPLPPRVFIGALGVLLVVVGATGTRRFVRSGRLER